MKSQIVPTPIPALARLLSSKSVHASLITQALELICGCCCFHCGFIYEIDQYNCFRLKENFNPGSLSLPQRFFSDDIPQKYRDRMAKETFFYIQENTETDSSISGLLHIFSASALIVYAITDEDQNIIGIIVFSICSADNAAAEVSEEDLSALLSILGNYTSARMYHNKLAFARTSLENILDNTGIDIYVNDFYNHDILYVNKSMAAPYGGISKFSGRKCWQVLFSGQNGPCEFCPQKNLIDEQGNPTKVYTWDYQRAFDGSWFRVFSAAFQWVDGRLAHVVSSADITDNKKNEALIQYMANYDSLTNLPNRRMLVNQLEKLITWVREEEHSYLLFFDIDGFKSINDNYGHEAGDEFLIQLGEFFSNIPLLKNSIYRNGGDEFVALLSGKVTEANIRKLTKLIHQRFKEPWNLRKGKVFCSTSIGVACYPDDGGTAEELLHQADLAMYHIKNHGGAGTGFRQESGVINTKM